MRHAKALAALAATVAIAACVPRPAPPAPAPAPAPPPQAAPPPPPLAPQPPPPADWRDAPLSEGDWSYRGDSGQALAEFRSAGTDFGLRCEGGQMRLVLGGRQAPAFVIRTSYGERRLPANAALPASDPLLDEIAFSRGRFQVAAEGGDMLILPSWPEVARVIEECRSA